MFTDHSGYNVGSITQPFYKTALLRDQTEGGVGGGGVGTVSIIIGNKATITLGTFFVNIGTAIGTFFPQYLILAVALI